MTTAKMNFNAATEATILEPSTAYINLLSMAAHIAKTRPQVSRKKSFEVVKEKPATAVRASRRGSLSGMHNILTHRRRIPLAE
jgi:hypothetical protein